MYTPRLYKAQMPRFLCTVYTYSTRLLYGVTYTHSFGTDTHTWRFRPLIYSCLQIPPRENWFQYVRRVYETAINFPYITALEFNIFMLYVRVYSVQCTLVLFQANILCLFWLVFQPCFRPMMVCSLNPIY